MKRTLTFLMALVLLLGLALPAYAAETETLATGPALTLSADKTTLAPGQTVTVTLTLDQALSSLNNYQFNVLYDAARFELTGSTVGAAPTVVSAPRKDEQSGADCITVSGLSTEGLEVGLAAGTVATMTFTVLEAAQLGQTEFTVTIQALPSYADPTATVALTVVNNAKVTQEEASAVVLGDVTLDGTINVSDALAVYKHVRGKVTLEGNAFLAADVNQDDIINVSDALNVYKYVRGKLTSFASN